MTSKMPASGPDIADLWADYHSSLKGFLVTRVSNPSDVDDLLQEILIKTHANLHTLNDKSSLKPWLFQIARHVLIDYYRKNSKARPTFPEELQGNLNAEMPLPDLERCIDPFLKALPEELSKLLRDIDINGKSQKEEAERLGVSYSTLKSRVQSGRKQLKNLYEECCDFSIDARGNVVDYHPKTKKHTTC